MTTETEMYIHGAFYQNQQHSFETGKNSPAPCWPRNPEGEKTSFTKNAFGNRRATN